MSFVISGHKTLKMSKIKRQSERRQSKWKNLMLDLLNLNF